MRRIPTRYVHGVSLIEVMMAVLVFSVGILGLSSFLIVAFRSNQAGYQRTQVEFLAMSMADRMRANPLGVWAGGYNSTSYPVSGTQACTKDSACTPAKLALRDQALWSSQLKAFLPNPTASITCTNGAAANPTQLLVRPPYAGNCVMSISWTERGAGDKDHQDANPRTYVWNFQP